MDDAIWGSPTINMTQDAVQEFKVFRNQFDAQYGVGAQRGHERRHQVGHQQLQRHRLLLRPQPGLNARNAFATDRARRPTSSSAAAARSAARSRMNKTHFFAAFEVNNVDTVNIVALPATNPFARGIQRPVAVGQLDTRWRTRRSITGSATQHSMFVRYAYDNQKHADAAAPPTANSDSTTTASRTASSAEENWVAVEQQGERPARAPPEPQRRRPCRPTTT